ncbi:protein lifeguard 1-like [Crassostrea angulata]|uniref:protein lifeguard 1-like n=1 Tax=Magallana angulata TaxID=2784310 RepID=UPI0022B0924A|nr:protein lifeguard 1-like [Crassostrea angulata]
MNSEETYPKLVADTDEDQESVNAPEDNESSAFSEKNVRLGFIRKVYGTLLCQFLVTILVMVMFLYIKSLKRYSRHNEWIWITALVVWILTVILFAFYEDTRRHFPHNMIFLGIFTLCLSVLLGAVASHYDEEAVLLAVGITAGVCFGLVIFSFQTKYDFTMSAGFLFVSLNVLIEFGFFAIVLNKEVLSVFLASLGALLFSIYFVIDIQFMLGGKHKYSLSPEDYIFASLNLYLDGVILFFHILSIVREAKK